MLWFRYIFMKRKRWDERSLKCVLLLGWANSMTVKLSITVINNSFLYVSFHFIAKDQKAVDLTENVFFSGNYFRFILNYTFAGHFCCGRIYSLCDFWRRWISVLPSCVVNSRTTSCEKKVFLTLVRCQSQRGKHCSPMWLSYSWHFREYFLRIKGNEYGLFMTVSHLFAILRYPWGEILANRRFGDQLWVDFSIHRPRCFHIK